MSARIFIIASRFITRIIFVRKNFNFPSNFVKLRYKVPKKRFEHYDWLKCTNLWKFLFFHQFESEKLLPSCSDFRNLRAKPERMGLLIKECVFNRVRHLSNMVLKYDRYMHGLEGLTTVSLFTWWYIRSSCKMFLMVYSRKIKTIFTKITQKSLYWLGWKFYN